MRSVITVGCLLLLLSAPPPIARAQSSPRPTKDDAAPENEKAAILEVIERQSAAFWAKDFQRWADTWVHADYIRRLGWSPAGGVSSIQGWEAIGALMKKTMADNPKPK